MDAGENNTDVSKLLLCNKKKKEESINWKAISYTNA